MPAMIACPNTNCDFPGPLGFNEPKPWGTHFYHSRECPGAWVYNDKWYNTEAEAWEQYKQDNPNKPKIWFKAFDARIIDGNHAEYERLIELWRDSQ